MHDYTTLFSCGGTGDSKINEIIEATNIIDLGLVRDATNPFKDIISQMLIPPILRRSMDK